MEYDERTPLEIIRESKQNMIDSYRKLASVNENNPLLQLVTIHPNGQEISCSNKFHRKFTHPEDDLSSRALDRYTFELNTERIREGPTPYHPL